MTKQLWQIAHEAVVGFDSSIPPDAVDQYIISAYTRIADAVAAEVLKQCIAACDAERVKEADPTDGSYNTAIDHCIAAIKDLT